MAKERGCKFEKGSSNVFADVGYKNPEEALFKAELIRQINHIFVIDLYSSLIHHRSMFVRTKTTPNSSRKSIH